jgi:hypothetical protein
VLGGHLDLAAEVHQEGPVGDPPDGYPRHGAHGLDEFISVLGVARGASDVDSDALVAGCGHVERCHQSPHILDRGGQGRHRPAAGRDLEPNSDRIGH